VVDRPCRTSTSRGVERREQKLSASCEVDPRHHAALTPGHRPVDPETARAGWAATTLRRRPRPRPAARPLLLR